MSANRSLRFALPQQIIHWFMALCILTMLLIGVGMVSIVTPLHLTLLRIHKPLGIAILLLVIIRFGLRLYYGAPKLPDSMPSIMKLAAELSHYAFYGLMFALPLIGWAMLSAGNYPAVVLGITLPPILPPSDWMHTILWTLHYSLAFAFFALVLVHIGAALFHAFIRRDGVFEAMVPASQVDGDNIRNR